VPPIIGYPTIGPPYSEVTGAICRVPSTSFAQSPWYIYTCPPVSVSGTVLLLELFPGTPSLPIQSIKDKQVTVSVTTSRLRNINLIPIDYAFRPRLRGRLTLRGLTWRRNPWTFGGHVSHMPYYATHVSIRTSVTSRAPHGYSFTGLRNAPLPGTRRQRTEGRN
jgi:hypothetical protein